MIDTELIFKVSDIARGAAFEIKKLGKKGRESAVLKEDKSPVTDADMASHRYIVKHLGAFSNFPIISEESADNFETKEEYYWLVDPLDGTKGFIKGNAAYTVNIGLIRNERAILGVIVNPESSDCWAGAKGVGFFKNGQIFSRSKSRTNKAVISKSHATEKEKTLLDLYDIKETINEGSSIKFCYVAEGRVDLYPRFGPTSEWDTAAGQAIAEAANCMVIDHQTKEQLIYAKEKRRNEAGFLVCRKELIKNTA